MPERPTSPENLGLDIWGNNEKLLREVFGKEEVRLLAVAEIAVRLGARHVRAIFGTSEEQLETRYKPADDDSPQTVADRESSKRIRFLLERAFPDANINEEESGASKGEKGIFYADPLDGTGPFTREQPYSTTGIIYYENGDPIVAAVCAPFEQKQPKLYIAERGNGAFQMDLTENMTLVPKSEKRLRVSEIVEPKRRVMYVDANFNPTTRDPKAAFLKEATKHAFSVRMTGSNIDQWIKVSSGRAEATLTDSIGGHWDLAGLLLVKEAGGGIANLQGEVPVPGDQLALGANNEKFLRALVRITQQCYPSDYNEHGFRGKK